MKRVLRNLAASFLAALVALVLPLRAQEPAAFKKEEIEQLVAPIALYPDALVAQVLMASTYPLEVVQAARWSKSNPELKDKALQDALEKQHWDPSVKSLTAFPGTLAMMSERLDWTQKLGDAFLAQQKEVLAAVQQLRSRAQAAGNLKSTKEQKVTVEQQEGTTVIKIEPTDPQVVYVPTYNSTVVYGPWPYPAYPPYYWPPPVYYAPGTVFFGFTIGIAIGAGWGGCNWHGGNVYVDHRTYNNFNRTDIKTGDWQHRPEHRKGVEYRDPGSRQKYGGGQRPGVDSRESFRGRADQGRQDIARAGPADMDRDRAGGDRAGGPDVGDRQRDAGGARDRAGARQPDAFDGVGRGADTRNFSSRGASSRASSASFGRAGGGGRRR
ncbi:MAG TPA: DUF3300 domain-containing protein [Burkholderiales bacterium]|jgi:hypothetical protein